MCVGFFTVGFYDRFTHWVDYVWINWSSQQSIKLRLTHQGLSNNTLARYFTLQFS